MSHEERRILENVIIILKKMLQGEKVNNIQIANCPKTLEPLVKLVNELIYSFSEIWDFILPLSQGVLNIESPRASNMLASPFKELHSQLRTLVWQVQQIARGDYKQRVVFMGEFSQAFNSMVQALEEKDKLSNEYIEHLESEAQSLRESKARYDSVMKNSPGGIYIFDPLTMKVVESNEQFNRMMGYSKEEIIDLTVYDFYSERAIAEEDLKDILRKSLYSINNRQYRLKNGKTIEVDIDSCWSVNSQSNVVIVSVQDVTERNKAQEIAIKYKALLENARDIMLFADLEGKILEANKAAEDTYGYSRDELLSLNIYDLTSKDDREMVRQYMKEANAAGVTFETMHLRKDGTYFPVEVSSQGIEIGSQKIIGKVIRDITDRKRIEDNLRYFTSYDVLTRLPNRRLLKETYNKNFIKANYEGQAGVFLLIDVDNFKFINDTFGHTVGDMLLVELVSILKAKLRKEDFLARLEGDEFCVLLKEATMEEGKAVAEKLRRAVEEAKLCLYNYKVSFGYTISIGVAPIYYNIEFKETNSYADYALHHAKEQGRNRVFCVSNEDLSTSKLSETNHLIFLINNALEREQLVLFFQPVVNLLTGETTHHEALMRIFLEDGKMLHPGQVIPVAERFGLMSQIDRKIIKLSLDALKKYPKLRLFINLSGVSIGDDELLKFIEDNIQKTGIEPSRLGFEITETVAVKDLARADRWIRQLRKKGCKFALDDFGIGFSSFSYLQYLSVDFIKIDGSYIHDLDKNFKNRALVQAINTVACSLGKKVIAEFVENKSVLDILKEDHISHAQGYYLGYPEAIPKYPIVEYIDKTSAV